MAYAWLFLGAAAAAAGIWYSSRPVGDQIPGLPPPRCPIRLVALVAEPDAPCPMVEWAAGELERYLGVEVFLSEKPIVLTQTTMHHLRRQHDAVALAKRLSQTVEDEVALLALTEFDLYSSERKRLNFAMGARCGQAALVSAFRMTAGVPEELVAEVVPERLRKMVLRYAAELVFGFGRSQDPASLLCTGLEDPAQLDLMKLRF